ncbi:MAG: type I methionyl aminopeptidase [Ruminococcaceae bacterium]|nr:type I methionyl aminopeptidase [Oscillospiraceae bacterium]
MIQLKNSAQIAAMKEAGRITGEALLVAREHVREGVSTYELDALIRAHIERAGAKPSFLGYGGFPASACISINDEVIHGIPSRKRILQEGDVVKIDVGAFYRGFHGDSARTIAVGRVSDEAEKLIRVTRQSFFAGVEQFRAGNRMGDIGSAVQACVEREGFSVVRRYIGHGIGRELHEQPDVPNFGTAGRGTRLCAGMVLAIEPMVNVGGEEVKELSDGWTVKTVDHSLSAHYENTVALTSEGIIITTLLDADW